MSGSKVKKYSTTTSSWSEFPINKGDDAKNCELNVKDCITLLVKDPQKEVATFCSGITGKPMLKLKQRTLSCNLSLDGKQIMIVSRRYDRSIYVLDTVRRYHIKSLDSGQVGNSSLRLIEQRFLAIEDNLVLQDISAAQTSIKIPSKKEEFKDRKYNISIDHSANQVAYFITDTDLVLFEQLPTATVLSAPAISIRGTNNKGPNLQGVIVSSSDKLSEKNIMRFQMRGNYGAFNDSILHKLFPSSSEESKDVIEVTLVNDRLAPIHARIIGSNTYWSNLRKLDLSRNAIDDEEEEGEAIGGNKSWSHLEELTLTDTQIGNKTAIKVANNHILKNLKNLSLLGIKLAT